MRPHKGDNVTQPVSQSIHHDDLPKSIATPTARAPRFIFPLLLPLLLLGLLAAANAQASGDAVSYLPPIGGSGGGQFKAPCGATENLMGFELRVGDDVDAIRPVCELLRMT